MTRSRRHGLGTAPRLLAQCLLLATLFSWADAFLTPQQFGELPGAHREVPTPAGFLQALLDPKVTSIHITEDIIMSEETWPATIIHLYRNITIESDERDPRLINFTRVWGKILIEPEVNLVFRKINLAGLSIGSAFSFIAASPGGTLTLQDGAWKTPVCPPYGRKMMSMLVAHPRPPGFPGLQKLGPSLRPFCLKNTCYQHVFVCHDWVSSQPLLQDEAELGAYMAVLINVNWVCDVAFSDACVVLKGYEICRKEMFTHYLNGVSNTYDSRARLMAMVLTALVCVAIALGFAYTVQKLHRSVSNSPTASQITLSQLTVSGSSHGTTQLHSSNRSDEKLHGGGPGSRGMGHFSSEGSINNVALGSVLGSGSYGVVYQGSWQRQLVAVKIIPHDRQTSEKITSEADLSLSVVHPNVVRTFHHFTIAESDNMKSSLTASLSSARAGGSQMLPNPGSGDDHHYSQQFSADNPNQQSYTCLVTEPRRTWIVQELCDLGALPNHLQSELVRNVDGHIDQVTALHYALDVAKGMAYLHELNICHGDLKACNTLLMSAPPPAPGEPPGWATCKVSDFGLSRVMAENRTHLSTHTIGTITHMPPELLLDGLLTRECDVYSYGILLWEICTGQALYAKMNPVQIMNKVITEDARPAFPPHVADDLVHLARECWARNVSARPAFPEIVVRLQGMLRRATQRRGSNNRQRTP